MPDARRTFYVPGGMLIPSLAGVISIWLLTGVSQAQAIAGAIALISGAVLYIFFKPGEVKDS